jgi:hypothetical protein
MTTSPTPSDRPDVLTPAAADPALHAPVAHFYPQPVLPKMVTIHIIIGLVLTYAGLFTMMTVLFAGYGATLAMIGAAYTATMLMLNLRDGDARAAR